MDQEKPSFNLTNMREERRYSVGQRINGGLVVNNPVGRTLIVRDLRVILKGVLSYVNRDGPQEEGHERNKTLVVLPYSFVRPDNESVVLRKGKTTHPFSLQICENFPASWNSQITDGFALWYSLDVEIKYLSGKLDRETLSPITVVKQVDLNLDERLAQSKLKTVRRNSNLWSCYSGLISGHLELPHNSGFVPGESIDFRFKIEIENNSGRDLHEVKVLLERVIMFSTGLGYEVKPTIINQMSWGQEEVAKWKNWIIISSDVPGDAPQTHEWDGVIGISYFLKMVMRIGGMCWGRRLSAKLPIVIGTIPITSAQEIMDGPLAALELDNTAPSSAQEPMPSTSNQA